MGCSNEVLTVVSMLSVPSVFFRPPDRWARQRPSWPAFFSLLLPSLLGWSSPLEVARHIPLPLLLLMLRLAPQSSFLRRRLKPLPAGWQG